MGSDYDEFLVWWRDDDGRYVVLCRKSYRFPPPRSKVVNDGRS